METRATSDRSKSPRVEAERLADQALSGTDWASQLKGAMVLPLGRAIERAIVEQVALHTVSQKAPVRRAALQLLREALGQQGHKDTIVIDGQPIEFDFSDQHPDWLRELILRQLREQLDQPYWVETATTATRNRILPVLEEAVENGWGMKRAAKELSDRLGGESAYPRQRAEAITRTELASSSNAGALAGIEEVSDAVGESAASEWLTAFQNSRASHIAADGQVVAVGSNFNVGDETAPYPAHHSLSAAERVRCQCTIVSALLTDEIE